MTKKTKFFFIFLTLAYLAVWLALTLPYRPFPSDDDYFRSFIDEPGIVNTALMIVRSHHPVLLASLKLTHSLLLHAVISNSVLLFLVSLIVFSLTGNVFVTAVSALLYGLSSWPAVYYFLYSYTPFSAMLLYLSLYFILRAYLDPDLSARRLIWAGIFSGLAFWSSPSAGVMIVVYFLILFYLFPCHSRESGNPEKPIWIARSGRAMTYVNGFLTRYNRFKKKNNPLWIYSKSLFLTILPFSFLSFPALKDHIWENCRQYAGADVEVLKTPFFSFFHILGEHSGLFLAGFFFLLVFCLITVILKRGSPACLPPEKAVRALTLGVFAHSFLIDILPSTKLARTNFVLYPLFIIVMVSLFWFLFIKLSQKFRYVLLALAIALSLPLVYANLKWCRQLIQARQAVPAYLAGQPKDQTLYILEEDSHADAIISWLEGFSIQRVKKADLEKVMSDNRRGALIIGPRAQGSGRSILSNCCMDDFLIDDIQPRLEKMNRLTLPYYAYFPLFLLEEEVCEGLYLSGRRVDYKSESKQITIVNFSEIN